MQTNAELNRALAEALGWRVWLKTIDGIGKWVVEFDEFTVRVVSSEDDGWSIVPNYATDLNAIMPLALEAARELGGDLVIFQMPHGTKGGVSVHIRTAHNWTIEQQFVHSADDARDLARALCLLWLEARE